MSLVPVQLRCEVSVRVATMADVPFIDQWQNKHHDAVGWMPKQQMESKISAGHVLVAEDAGDQGGLLGYVISRDQYMKRDDLGIIYQLNVMPTRQRSLIGATLIREVFERSAYGCKLYCCWCAQDLDANYFWESIGFIPLAFRTGARGKCRTHIFWQRRIREGDTVTPYWFPSETTGGSMRENRLVLPIPPGTHWKDVMPVVLPGAQRALPDEKSAARRKRSAETPEPQKKPKRGIVRLGGVSFAPPPKPDVDGSTKLTAAKPKKAPKAHVKNDPAHVAAARELRDRYLEQFNAGMALPNGKYDVARPLPSPSVISQPLQLPQAA